MRILLLSLLLSSCVHSKPEKKIWARITYYHGSEDSYGYRVAADSRIRNKPGYGVSAHPDFKFYTKIRIPALRGVLDADDEFTVIDRGSAVTKKKASKGKTYVFDVFVPRKEFKKIIKSTPAYTWVIIK